MTPDSIPVDRSEQFATFRQTVTPENQESVVSIVAALIGTYRANHITGPITINLNQGGVRNIIADQTAKVPEGSPADTVFDEFFGR